MARKTGYHGKLWNMEESREAKLHKPLDKIQAVAHWRRNEIRREKLSLHVLFLNLDFSFCVFGLGIPTKKIVGKCENFFVFHASH